MADIKSPEARSENMSAIKSKNTKPELFLRKLIFSRGYRYRIHSNNIPGHPDIWLSKYKVAIFVNGCFWHRHKACKYAYTPKSRIEFWNQKFEQNIERDLRVKDDLLTKGIRCLIVWECSIEQVRKGKKASDTLISEIETFLHSEKMYAEL